MCENCTKSIAKIVLIIVNLIFLLAGLLLLSFSVAAFVDPFKVMSVVFEVPVNDDGLNELVRTIGVFGIILGSVVVVVAFFGFVGAACENLCFLVMYLVLIIIILLAQIALIITAALYSFNNLTINSKSPIDNFILSDIQTDENNTIIRSSNPWTMLQLRYSCCGMRGHEEYNLASTKEFVYQGRNYTSSVPLSCCAGELNGQTWKAKDIDRCRNATISAINQPCYKKLEKEVKNTNQIILGVAAGIVGLELLVIIFASILIHHLRQEKNQIV